VDVPKLENPNDGHSDRKRKPGAKGSTPVERGGGAAAASQMTGITPLLEMAKKGLARTFCYPNRGLAAHT